MMTSSGARRLPGPSLRVRSALISRPSAPGFDGVVSHYVELYKLIGSPGYPSTDAWLHQRMTLAVRRSYRPRGAARQLAAIAADGDRTPLLQRVGVPTQVLHGAADPLIPVAAGHDLARRIAGARLDVVEGMGHDLPPALWPRFVSTIEAAAGRA
jgi:pimeloyl-ACP methyl ester carboxylesterase